MLFVVINRSSATRIINFAMGRNVSKKKLLKKQISDKVSDVTLNECANNLRKLNVVKKNIGLTEIGQLNSTESVSQEENSDSDEDAQVNYSLLSENVNPVKAKHNRLSGVTYPSDIWYLIAPYIQPEDLCTFARLCKDSYKVLLSAQFWKRKLKGFQFGDELPIELRTSNDLRRGLRTRVIRIMFFLHPSLAARIKPPVSPRYEPYTLQGMRLLLNWHEKQGNVWNYYFKWSGRKSDVFQNHKNEIFDNQESDCRILKATSSQFFCIKYPQYYYLSNVQLSLTSDMRQQKLTLGLSDYTTTHASGGMNQNLGRKATAQNHIVLEPISNCIVMDWWHPEYPYPRALVLPDQSLCSNDDDQW